MDSIPDAQTAFGTEILYPPICWHKYSKLSFSKLKGAIN